MSPSLYFKKQISFIELRLLRVKPRTIYESNEDEYFLGINLFLQWVQIYGKKSYKIFDSQMCRIKTVMGIGHSRYQMSQIPKLQLTTVVDDHNQEVTDSRKRPTITRITTNSEHK